LKQIQVVILMLISAVPQCISAQNVSPNQQSMETSAQIAALKTFWGNAYKAAQAYFSLPSPETAKKFYMALPDKRLPSLDPDGEFRLSDLVFDFWDSGMAKNFSILKKDMEEGEPNAVDVGFRLINISDGGNGEALLYALGHIIDRHPILFLQKIIAHQGESEPSALELLDDILDPVAWWEQQQDEAGYPELLKRRLEIRIKALESVNDNDLKEIRDRCLTILKNQVHRL